MPDPELIAQRLARCVELFRDPDAKQVQKAEFRTLLGLLKDQTVVITESAGQLVVNGVRPGQGRLAGPADRAGQRRRDHEEPARAAHRRVRALPRPTVPARPRYTAHAVPPPP